jgi:hypothetical protein
VLASAVPSVAAVDERLTVGATVFGVELAVVLDVGVVVLEPFPLAGSTVVVVAVGAVVVVLPPLAGAMVKGVENTLGAVKSFWF